MSDFEIIDGKLIKYHGTGENVVIPDGVTSIGDSAFSECRSLTSITIPDGVTSIGDSAFSWCIKLTSITIPEGVTSIGFCTFSWCSSLTNITIPKSVTSIGVGAFEVCENLNNVIIPENVTSIGDSAFSCCSSLTSITIPDGVTSIGDKTFSGCSSLTSITIPDSVTSIGVLAFDGCSSLTSIMIPDSVTSIGASAFEKCRNLTSIMIPESVTSIKNRTFFGCSSLTNITVPDSVTNIGDEAFGGCSNLKKIDCSGAKYQFGKNPFGYSFPDGLKDQCFSLIPHFTDGSLKEYVLMTYLWKSLTSEQQIDVFLSRQSKTLSSIYPKCISDDLLMPLGDALEARLSQKPSAKDCSAAALYMTGFKEKVPTETLQKLYSLLQHVKSASKALATIDNDLVLKEKLGQEPTIAEDLDPVEQLVMEKLIAEKQSQKNLEERLKEYYGIIYTDLPEVLNKSGNTIKPYVLAWLLQAHEEIDQTSWPIEVSIAYKRPGICHEAKEILDELDEESFQAAILELSKRFLGKYVNTKKKFLCYPICRYANEAVMSELAEKAAKWKTSVSGIDAPPLLQFRKGCIYSNTRAAMISAERYHDLDIYAESRDTDVDTLQCTVLAEFGLDETGKKLYDLDNTVVEAVLQDDLTLSLYDRGAQKTVKSIPKRNSDPEKYEAAKADLFVIRKNIKRVAKVRINTLFEEFLSGKEYDSANWQKIHFSNPLINRIARLLVWEQEGATFTLSSEGAIDFEGCSYTVSSKPIRLAHPMEMEKTDVEVWRKFFTNRGLKQPFAQVWEPVIDPEYIKEDRYTDTVLPLMRFNGKDKHGIIGIGFTSFSEDFEVEFKDCNLELEPSTWRLDSGLYDEYTYKLGRFTFNEYTRYTNHIVGILDRWTVEQRILNDDVSVTDLLGSFTVAQVSVFINEASEHNCSNVTAALLDYKNTHFAEFNAMDEFVMEW